MSETKRHTSPEASRWPRKAICFGPNAIFGSKKRADDTLLATTAGPCGPVASAAVDVGLALFREGSVLGRTFSPKSVAIGSPVASVYQVVRPLRQEKGRP